jgi:hypothetical protein
MLPLMDRKLKHKALTGIRLVGLAAGSCLPGSHQGILSAAASALAVEF